MKKKYLLILFSLFCSITAISQTITNVGTDFWIAFPPNGSPWQINLFISSNFSTSGTVVSAFPGVNQNFIVTPGVVTQLSLPVGICLQGGIEDKGIHIVSNDPISVYGLNKGYATTDAFLALPVNALGLDYRIVTYKTSMTNLGSCFSVIATQDATVLNVFNHQTNSTTNINLNQGQTYHVEAPNVGEDVTGSRVQSNFPVAVFGSTDMVQIPELICGSADHIVEQMFPYYSWGKNFVTVPLAGRDASGDIFRIVTAQDGTDISINGILVATINSGDYYESNLTGYNSITTSQPVILAQFAKGIGCSGGITGDPFMMLIPPREQFLTNYTFSAVAGFVSHWVNVVAPDYALGTIYQDGVLIPNTAFIQIGTTNYYGAQRPVSEGSHTFTSTFPFGVFVYGWTPSDSYGYPGGCSLSPVGMVNSVTISPPTATGTLDVSTLCFTAHVEDYLLNPVAGVLVTFNISGISNITGNAYTDASGNAQYCYARTGTTTGTDNIYAECFGYISTTSTANWILDCLNPTGAGTIGGSQSGCGSFTPSPLTSLTLPSGQSGTMEYKWQQSTTNAVTGFIDIAVSNSPDYSPGLITQTTWYRRVVRVDCKSDWTGAANTDALEMTVTIPVTPSVAITADFPQVCAGENVTFTATTANEGTSPAYQWKVNGANSGTSTSVFSYIPLNGDQVTCLLTSSMTCTTNNPVNSNTITMIVNPIVPIGVTISSSANTVCAGTTVTFTAFPVNGGSTPAYQWKVNGANVGSNSTGFTYTPVNGDIVFCVLTSSNNLCTLNNPATSNPITMVVNPLLPVSVTISPTANPICTGNPVTLTATPINGGFIPVFQWTVNGINIGTNNSVFAYLPVNGDVVTCSLLSSETCTSGNPAQSNPVTMVVNANLPAGITISASANPFCPGTTVTFIANPINGGSTPSYQWKVNGINTGTNSSTFIYTTLNNDSIRCIMTSNLSCVTGNPASSAKIIMSGTLAPIVSFTSCFDTVTTVGAKAFKLKGGMPLGGSYSGPGVNSLTGVFTPSSANIGLKTISYTYTNVSSCSANKTKTILVQANPSFTCGSNFTDIRDGKLYTTVQIGTQCWMAANLNYGSIIPSSQVQYDNCISEKYCYNDVTGNCTKYGGLYQWDEVMKYDDTQAGQGLCPPGWHVPTDSEWTTLFNFYQGNALAGKPLQDTILSGFKAQTSGVFYLNSSWSFNGFATLFWSSTTWSAVKAISHGMNIYDFSVSLYPSSKVNAFPIRCLKE